MVEDFKKIKEDRDKFKKKLDTPKKIEPKKVPKLGKNLQKVGNKILKKPKAKIRSVDPKKAITQGMGKRALVSEGRTGYFKKEYVKESKWLS